MLYAILIGGFLGSIVLMLGVAIRLRAVNKKYRYHKHPDVTVHPTVSVCIPARNETHAMTMCLERVLASDYERLEIIVLDDSSVDDTSVLIKSFAQEGVRFVEGSPLPDEWLGKNHALQGLLEEASGSLVLFIDVDTVIQPHTISRLVNEANHQKASFLSVMPQREDGLRASVFLGTLRYLWPLILPSRHATLPTSGSCMLVERKQLLDVGGFKSSEANIEPEAAIAYRFHQAGETVSYLISNRELGVSYEKKWSSQIETSIRLLAPLFGSSVLSLIVAILMVLLVALPAAGFVYWVLNDAPVIGILLIVSLLMNTITSLLYFKAAWRYGWWLGALHWPYTVTQEAMLLVLSVVGYARQTITWKGRPVRTGVRSR